MHERPTERARALLDGLTAHAIVERVHPYYNGFQFEGEWLDALKAAICDELDEVDAKVPGTCKPVISDNLNESEGTGDAWADCSACGHLLFVLTDPNSQPPNYCPSCGRRVERGDES